MGVYIKGMEMPTSCGQCRFFAWSRGVGQHCAVDDRITFHATLDGFDVGCERNGTCPLVPVPPHGRMIDADALENRVVPASRFFEIPNANVVVLGVIKAAPTIIPADEPFGKSEQLNV